MKKIITLTIEKDVPLLMALGTQKEREELSRQEALKSGREDMAAVCKAYIQELERTLDAIRGAPWET